MAYQYKIGYEQTDSELEIEIYGLVFVINKMSEDLKKELEELTKSEADDFTMMYSAIDKMLGENASQKINDKRVADGYKKLNCENIIAIFNLIASIQAKEIIKAQKKGMEDTKNITNEFKNRNYNKGYNNGYRNNYNNNYRR